MNTSRRSSSVPPPATDVTTPTQPDPGPASGLRGPRFWWVGVALLVVGGIIGLGLVWNAARPPEDFSSIRSAMDDRRFAEAEAGLHARLARSSDDELALMLLGVLQALTGRDPAARQTFERINGPGPVWTQAQTHLGEIAMRSHQLAEAETTFRAVADRDPAAVDARRRLVYIATLTARPTEAQAVLRELIQLDPSIRHLITLTGLEAPETENRLEETDLDTYLRVTPADPILRRARGLAAFRAGRLAEARPDLEFAAHALDDDPVGRIDLAECQVAAGDLDQVAESLGAEPTVNPRLRARWWLVRAQLAKARNQPDQELADARQALAAHPDDRAALYRVGQLLSQAGQATEAAELLARSEAIRARDLALVLELDRCIRGGVDADLYDHIADLCRESGMIVEARAWYEEVIRLDPIRTSAQASLARLKSLPDPPLPPHRLTRKSASPIRPETAAAPRTDSAGVVALEDIADRSGLSFTYNPHPSGNLFLGDTMGGGVGLIDFDEDGFLDVYLVGGCPLPIPEGHDFTPNKLFRNRRDGTFEDVTDRANVAGHGYGMGCAVADFDNDGHDDLYVTGLNRAILYRNRGDGTFEDVTERAGVGTDRWSTAAGFADLDGDGDLDLVVVTYVHADPAQVPECFDPTGRPFHCPPGQFTPQFDLLFRNNGDGTFTDVSHDAGLEVPGGLGLGLALADFDADGKLDLFVANDAAPNFFFRNLGDLKFEELGVASGMAYDGSGRATASMGVVAEDLDGDALIDLLHVNFLNEPVTLLRNLGSGLFDDITTAAGLDTTGRSGTGFGAVAFDLENDGLLDLFIANGHVDDRPWANHPMAQRPHLFRARNPGHFALAPPATSPYLGRTLVGRGAAGGDLDNDGRTDLVVIHRDAPVALLRNSTPNPGHWVQFRLVGGDRSGRTPVGARVTCRAGKTSTTRWLVTGTSYLAAQELRIPFGLGSASGVDHLEIRWPSGVVESWSQLVADQIYEIREGHKPVPDPRLSARDPRG